jgi:hypothetical protein
MLKLFLIALPLHVTAAPTGVPRAPLETTNVTTPADGREEVANLIAEMREFSSKRGSQALEAQAAIGRLTEEFAASGPKDKAEIVSALARLFETRPVSRGKDKEESDPLLLAAAEALGRMGPQSVGVLIGLVGRGRLEADLPLQRKLLLALGATRDKRALDPLVKALQDKDAVIVAAAGEALGSFEAAEQPTRKQAFEEILKVLTSTKSSSDRYAQEQGTAREPQPSLDGSILADRYETIRAPLLGALRRLSKHEESEPEAWQRWWNKNKKASWEPQGE